MTTLVKRDGAIGVILGGLFTIGLAWWFQPLAARVLVVLLGVGQLWLGVRELRRVGALPELFSPQSGE